MANVVSRFRRSLVLPAVAIATTMAPLAAVAQEESRSEIVPPARLDDQAIPYPEGAEGEALVTLELEIERDGTVGNIFVKEGAPPFSDAARVAARDWRFSPATRNGIPIRARILAQVAFHEPAPPPAATPSEPTQESTSPTEPAESSPAASPREPIEVMVVGESPEEPGSTHIPRNETRLVPGAFADPFRVVEVLPGVAPILSGIPYFTVRGSPPSEVGYFIDGIHVPLLFHVGAGPSVIAPGLVDRVDLFPSVYPARFGRNAGGIMAGETMAPSPTAHGEAQARVFDAGAMAEQPFANGKGSILLGGRYGYTGALLAIVAPDYSLSYWDYQARLAYRIADHDRLSVFAFGAYDYLRNETIGRTLFNVEFHRIDARWDHDDDRLHTRLAATLSSDLTLNAQENTSDPGSTSVNRGVRIRFELDDRITNDFRVRAGADAGLERFTSDQIIVGGVVVPFGAHTDRYGGGWIDFVSRPANGVEIVPGFRLDLFKVRNEATIAPEPRLATRLRIAEGVAWISAFGVTHQVPTFVIPVPGTQRSVFDASNQEVWQASQSVQVALPWRISAKATLFRNVAFLTDIEGRAHNYGAELFLHRDFTESLGGFISYTVSRADRERGTARELSMFDRTHVLSAVLGYDLGAGFRIGGRLFVASGRPFTIACPTPGCVGTLNPPSSNQFEVAGRFPMFTRVDVRFERKWSLGGGASLSATFEWFNALLAKEIDTVKWTPTGLVFSGRSPLTLPSVGVEISY